MDDPETQEKLMAQHHLQTRTKILKTVQNLRLPTKPRQAKMVQKAETVNHQVRLAPEVPVIVVVVKVDE